jgi:ornithine cyclodeaminase
VIILSRKDIQESLTMTEAIQVVRDAYIAASTGKVKMPVRTGIDVGEGSLALFMPAFRTDTRGIALKAVTVFPGNRARRLPTIHAVVLYLDPETGAPAAVLEGSHITGLRTGAAGGLAADLLAVKDARVAAVIGAGVQGWFQLSALCAVRPIEQVWIVDVDRGAAERLANRAKTELRVQAEVADTAESAVGSADVVITATTSHRPVFDGRRLRPGAHITAIGAFTPAMRELDDAALRSCNRIFVDSREAVWAEAGDFIIPRDAGWFSEDRVTGEIGEVAAGLVPGRLSEHEITLFKSVGVAVLDLAVAEAVVEKAAKAHLGMKFDLGPAV